VLPSIAIPRLHLSLVSDGDIGLMRRLNADEAVIRNLTGRPATAEDVHAEWTERLPGRSDPGRGPGYWIGRADGVFVGWSGLGALRYVGVRYDQCQFETLQPSGLKRPGLGSADRPLAAWRAVWSRQR
jgi:hypothetical protein